MKSKLIKLIQNVIDLLLDCEGEEVAQWFSDLKHSIDSYTENSEEFNECLNKLDSVLAGMGSFSDLPLKDSTGKMSEQEVKNKQWELVEQIGDTIDKLRRN